MSPHHLRYIAGWLALFGMVAYPTTSPASGVPGGYAAAWRQLCPLIADAHGFVDSAAWRAMLRLPSANQPGHVDHWTSIETVSSDEPFGWGSRLQTSRYEAGRTSAWIEDPHLNLKEGYRSELSISGTSPDGQLALASVESAMGKLGFRKIGTVDPYGRDGEYVFVRVADPNERLNVRFEKGPETTPVVSGLTLVGYRWDNRRATAQVKNACEP
ncbi:hypothetical protein FIV34_18010 [Luteibacter pinisoli]|uniref:Uncharacterized protein n=1 Tax=Luteibacter pinisoli TaxID=2589080 RepID=A0A4Y5Z670_9GAMM|nr:hypothetical protein [Luteibacter pinisoli]QDE40970.1 hypothetical protein FIV34_18010 [Luteibacter pinisoli]